MSVVGSSLATSRSRQIIEKRKDPRYSTRAAAEVQVLQINGARVPATVVDISRSGLRLELETSLPKGTRIQIMIVPRKVVIFGEVRYCRRSDAVHHAGVLIEDVVFPRHDDDAHLVEDEISLYAVGKGLTVLEVLRVKAHLSTCEACSRRMAETTAALYPTTRRLSHRHDVAP